MKYRNRLMLAPDDGSTVAIPSADSPTGQQIDITPREPNPPPEIIQQPADAPKPIRQAGVKTTARDVAKELGLAEAPSESLKKLAEQVREKATGRFAPKKRMPLTGFRSRTPKARTPRSRQRKSR